MINSVKENEISTNKHKRLQIIIGTLGLISLLIFFISIIVATSKITNALITNDTIINLKPIELTMFISLTLYYVCRVVWKKVYK